MSIITSRQNSTIKHIRKLQSSRKLRRKFQQYVVEGKRLVLEALESTASFHTLVICEDYLQNDADFLAQLRNTEHLKVFVTPDVFESCSDTAHGQGVLAVLEIALEQPAAHHFVLVIDDVADPGNLGTILRTAAGAGIDCVYLSQNSVDYLSPKVLRSGMGAHFRLPVIELSWPEIKANLRTHATYIADVTSGVHYLEMPAQQNMALIVSNEADGASAAARTIATNAVHIPMANAVESLNVGVAAGVLLLQMMHVRKGL